MSVCYDCCVLSGRGLCDELITRPEEFYQLCRVVVCDLETSRIRVPWPALGHSATGKRNFTSLIFVEKIAKNLNNFIFIVNCFLIKHFLLLSVYL